MSYASDKLYNEYLRRNMARFVSKVRVKEILPHLPCLTQSDREEIEAKKDQHGNYDAMQLLLSNLTRRDNWPEEFIAALESCEHRALADEIRTKYNSLKTPRVVKACVPPPPPANPSLPVPESMEDSPAAGAPTPQAAAPPAPAPQSSPPPSPPVMPVAAPSPAPQAAVAAEPAQAPQPPASPDIARQRPSPPPAEAPQEVPGDEILIPSNALALDSQVSGVSSEIPSVSEPPVVHAEIPASSQADQFQAAHEEVSPSESAAPVQADPSSVAETPPAPATTETQATTETTPALATTETTPALATAETTLALATTETTLALATAETTPALATAETTPALATAETTLALPTTETPSAPAATESTPAPANSALEKHPVQDTTPPQDTMIPAPQQPVEDSDPTAQVTENDELAEPPQEDLSQHSTQTTVPPSPPVDSVDGANSTLSDGEAEYLSKPGILNSTSEEPFSGNISLQISTSASGPEPAALAPMTAACSAVDEEPFSENVGLQISTTVSGPEPAAVAPMTAACSADPEPLTVDNPSPCQENGVTEEPLSLYNNEPEENLFESTCQSSLGDQEVLTNVVQVSEEPSVQNHDGQTPSMLANAVSESEDPRVQNNDSQSQIILSGAVSGSDDLTESSLGNAACFLQDPPSQILNGQATKQPTSAPPACAVSISVTSASSNENSQNIVEDEATLDLKPQGQEDRKEKGTLPPKNQKNYILLTAAAVGVSALFVAWKLKN